MIDQKYKTLIKEVREISSDIARLDRDLERDRRDWADTKVEMARLAEEVKQVRKEMTVVANKVDHQVKDTLKPAIKEVKSLKDEIKKKKTMIVKPVKFFDKIRSIIKAVIKK